MHNSYLIIFHLVQNVSCLRSACKWRWTKKMGQRRGEGYLEWGSAIVVVSGGWRRWWQRLGGAVAAAGILSFLCAETDVFLSFPTLALLEFSFTFFYSYGLSSASPLSPLSILFFCFLSKVVPGFPPSFFSFPSPSL